MIAQISQHMNQSLITPVVNVALANKVIMLHNQGYILDFSVTPDFRLLCMQDEQLFTIDQVAVTLVDQRFDEISSCYKYIHVVETCCGDKGLLMDCCIRVNDFLKANSRIVALMGGFTQHPVKIKN